MNINDIAYTFQLPYHRKLCMICDMVFSIFFLAKPFLNAVRLGGCPLWLS